MFGYVRYDLPNLFIKDMMLYKAMYCGLCKGIAQSCTHASRMGLSYDMTFLSALLHNMTGTDVKIEKQGCFEHRIKKRSIAVVDDLTRELGALNTIMVYYKLTDDINDVGKGYGKRLWFKKGYKRAKRAYPRLDEIVGQYMKEQATLEKTNTDSPDRAAEATAQMMTSLSDHFLKDKATDSSRGLFYSLGKWVYLIDALDDYDKDKKKKNYNPFVLCYGSENKKELVSAHGDDLNFLFNTLFYSMRENLAGVKFYFNRDLTDNIILRGIPAQTQRILQGLPPQKMEVEV